MSRKRAIAVSAIALLCLVALTALDLAAPFAYVRARNLLRDAITRAGRKTPPNPNLVFLAIDSASVGQDVLDLGELYDLSEASPTELRALSLMGHAWPWPREVHALVLDRLVKAGAKVVMFDLLFPSPAADDEPFRLALEEHAGRVVIGSNFVSAASRDFTTLSATHSRPPDSLVLQTTPLDQRVAYTNFWPDEDDVVRHAQFRTTFEHVQGLVPEPASEEYLSLGARGLVKAGFADRVPAGLDSKIFRYTAPPRAGFRPYSLFEIFVPEYWKRNYKSGEFFRDKIIVVGAEGNWAQDEHATPFGSMPGPELHLNAINAALHGEFIEVVSQRSRTAVTIIAGLLAIGLTLSIRSPWLRLALMVAVNCLHVWVTLQVFNEFGTYVPLLPFLIEFNVTALLGLLCDFAWERLEKTRVRRTLEKYVSTNVVRELLDNPKQFEQSLGGVVKPVAILFSDLRGYSTVSAQSDPHALVGQLNEYLSAMVECVFRHGGTLDKFIGDAVMAVWGNVSSQGPRDDATNAVRAGLEMQSELARLNLAWRARGLPELRAGVAVNHGDVIVGNIGSPRRMEFTVIGDAVNVSWKLQELTKQVDATVVVSKTVSALVVEHFEVQPLGHFDVRGFPDLFEIFAVSPAGSVPEAADLETFQIH